MRLSVKREVRQRLEERFLGGRESLFSDTAELLDQLEGMAAKHREMTDEPAEVEETAIEVRAQQALAFASRVATAFMGWG